MFAAISAILGAIGNVIASIIKVIPWQAWACLAIFLFGGWVFYGGSCRDFCCSRKPRPRPDKWVELVVSSVKTGASLECSNARGRRAKSISLSFIVAPSDGTLAEQSRISLERLAGNFVRIKYQGILVRTTDDDLVENKKTKTKCCECNGSSKIPNICEINCLFCQNNSLCDKCKNTGKLQLNYDTIELCKQSVIDHINIGCNECTKNNKPCQVLRNKLMIDILASKSSAKTIECPVCFGTGKCSEQSLESKSIVSIVYNAYGQCLNTEQVRLGMAKLLQDSPKDWKMFENEAKKKKLGVWKK